MCASSSTILAKLEELKKWQEKQQDRLMQHKKEITPQNVNTTEDSQYWKSSCDANISSETKVNNKSVFKSSLEIQNKNAPVNKKCKQPYLRRGAGLVRFRMTPGEQFKPFTNSSYKSHSIGKQLFKTNVKNNAQIQENNVTKGSITTLHKPEFTLKSKASWVAPTNDENNYLLSHQYQDNVELLALNNGKEKEHKDVTDINPEVTTDKELLIFEALEQRVSHGSFCSTNSSVVQLLSSTPHKDSPLKTHGTNRNKLGDGNEPIIQEILDENTQIEDSCNDSNIVECKSQMYHINSKNHKLVIEEILKNNVQTIRNNAHKLENINEYEKKLENDYLNLIEKAIKFKRYVEGDTAVPSSASSINSDELEQTSENQFGINNTDFQDDKEWSDNENSIEEVTTENWEATREKTQIDAETMTDNVAEINSGELDDLSSHNTLHELETELQRIRAENIKTLKLKNDLERQKKEFEKYKKQAIKEIEEEKVRLKIIREEEKKKFVKEKMVFERYAKELQNKPNRKERQEISALKTEIAALQETCKINQTKTGMSQARLRNQIKSLERENAELKAEVEKLNMQNAKLLVNQKLSGRPSHTKILHEINKNITKLAQEHIEKQLISSDKPDKSPDNDYSAKAQTIRRGRSNTRNKSESHSDDDGDKSNKQQRSKSESTIQHNQYEEKENVDNTTSNQISDDRLEEIYDRTFKNSTYELKQRLSNNSLEENKKHDRTEKILSDGTKHVYYTNGNFKTISPDGNHITFKYYNGDVKETNLLEGTIKYYYQENKVTHITNADGSELIEFPNGQIEKRLKNGHCEIHYPNGITRQTRNDGTEEVHYPDGTLVTLTAEGERILLMPNGQKEIHTKEHKRREYPDGTIKILYPDGLQETRYANGRVRLKDQHGNLLMDSQKT